MAYTIYKYMQISPSEVETELQLAIKSTDINSNNLDNLTDVALISIRWASITNAVFKKQKKNINLQGLKSISISSPIRLAVQR